ncbi:nitrite/sulfite reductase [Geoalkalibacter sp.]|uniref:nitrite/sulfite reductase n=1 Tax=Geoalkalibacter sp. TaxID=3041440 RepID=UPI00272E548C|nr:nitrite/sulfite reductase [Geoalkalibacter sp.]
MTSDPSQQPAVDFHQLRLDGVYRMNDADELMLRIKVPAGVLSVEQALKTAELAERFAGARVHLTTRGSIELHRVRLADLPAIGRGLAAVGLTTRGACGGAVRGIACSTSFSRNFALTQSLVRRLHRHFAGNPHFENLPKKFKIGVEDGYAGSRHLIQDLGLVLIDAQGAEPRYDVWVAGGLGREPQAALLFAEGVAESRLLPLAEAVVRLHARHTPTGKRLKHVVRRLGEESFRRLLDAELNGRPERLAPAGLDTLPAPPTACAPVTAAIFAGDLDTSLLRRLATLARDHAGGYLAVTADQNLAFAPLNEDDRRELLAHLAAAGLGGASPEERTTLRVCVGNHACRMGLSPTREVARRMLQAMPGDARALSWAISGCPNSCSQPQLADFGVISSRLIKDDQGERQPRFDVYRRKDAKLGDRIHQELTLAELLDVVSRIK